MSKHLPPRAPNGRPWSGCFQNRGRLFSTWKQQPVSDVSKSNVHYSQPKQGSLLPVHPAVTNDYPQQNFKHRRAQSAKARMEISNTQVIEKINAKDNTTDFTGSDLAVYDVNMNLTIESKPVQQSSKRSSSVKESWLNQNIHQISLNKSASRPNSAKGSKTIPAPMSPTIEAEEKEETTTKDLKPSVYGYRLKRQVFGSNPDIFTSSLKPSPPSTMFKLDETQDNVPNGHQKCFQNASSHARSIPFHMEPLRPWLNETVSPEVIGVDPTTCLVFLPLNQSFDDLPVVPLI